MRSLLVALTALGSLSLAAPAYAATPSDIGPTGPADVHPEWGSTAGHDTVVRKGCRAYTYDYALTPPEGYWALETFVVGPQGKPYASGYFLTGADPLAGQGTFRLCRQGTRKGTWTIRGRVTVGDDFLGYQTGWLPDSTFTLTKVKKKRHR